MQCPQISDEKKSFASLTNNFWSFKKRIKKNIHQWGKTCFFFIRNLRALHLLFAGTYIRIWGHLYSAGITLQLYSALRFERLKRVQKSRAIPWEFWDEVFSLSRPSVCPHLTTVYYSVKDNSRIYYQSNNENIETSGLHFVLKSLNINLTSSTVTYLKSFFGRNQFVFQLDTTFYAPFLLLLGIYWPYVIRGMN